MLALSGASLPQPGGRLERRSPGHRQHNPIPAYATRGAGSAAGVDPFIPLEHLVALIEHDGRMYALASLIEAVVAAGSPKIGAGAPRSGQEMWAAIVRRWLALAAEIVMGARSVGWVRRRLTGIRRAGHGELKDVDRRRESDRTGSLLD